MKLISLKNSSPAQISNPLDIDIPETRIHVYISDTDTSIFENEILIINK